MKIVQSFWSKPYLQKNQTSKLGRERAGWNDSFFFHMSVALSCLNLRYLYSEVELVTDSYGKELLIDKLKLPYTSVKLELDSISDCHESMWALGKLLTYSIQEEPFIHVDNDVFLWKQFNSQIHNAGLVAQNTETSLFEPYKDIAVTMRDTFSWQPSELTEYLSILEDSGDLDTIAYNAGIIGGKDLNFIRDYSELALEILHQNRQEIEGLNDGSINVIVEQGLFWYLTNIMNNRVETLLELEIDPLIHKNPPFVEFELLPHQSYFHTLGGWKKKSMIIEQIAIHLMKRFPEHFEIIEKYSKS